MRDLLDCEMQDVRQIMGAIPTAKGVTFRVLASHAEKVYVIDSFNGWGETSTPLLNEKNEYWSTDVFEAKVRAAKKIDQTVEKAREKMTMSADKAGDKIEEAGEKVKESTKKWQGSQEEHPLVPLTPLATWHRICLLRARRSGPPRSRPPPRTRSKHRNNL